MIRTASERARAQQTHTIKQNCQCANLRQTSKACAHRGAGDNARKQPGGNIYYIWCVVCIVVQLLVVDNTHLGGRLSSAPKKWVSWALFLSLSRTSPSFFIFFTLHAGCRVSIYGGRVYTRRQQNKTWSLAPDTLTKTRSIRTLSRTHSQV
jgi:hypothetical protein